MEKPRFLLLDGKIVPWAEASVHLWTEMPKRGMNVFDAIRGYYDIDIDAYRLVALNHHLGRLLNSSDRMAFPPVVTLEELREGIAQLITALDYRSDIYIRPTIYVEEGGYELDPAKIKLGWYIVAFPLTRSQNGIARLSCVISPWRKVSNSAFPSTVKCGASYALTRLSHIFALQKRADEAILINDKDFVCETPGASIIILKEGIARTPPVEDGVLDGITRTHLLDLLHLKFGFAVEYVSIPLQSLHQADEVLVCGTLAGIAQVTECDGKSIGQFGSQIFASSLSQAYLSTLFQPACDLVEILDRRAGYIH